MLQIDHQDILSIEQGILPTPKVRIYWSSGPEDYTVDNYLKWNGADQISTRVSDDAKYEISHSSVVLLNKEYYFSRRFYYEIPKGQLVVIYDVLNDKNIERFRGKIRTVICVEQEITLTITA